jgi:2-haloacid dehalogenase
VLRDAGGGGDHAGLLCVGLGVWVKKMLPSVIAFDLFGTVFDLSGVARQEIKDYAVHLRNPEWSPLHLPKSWETLPAHPDSAEGIERLRRKFMVVTCSNGPLGLTAKLSKHNGISWDAIIPLELNRVYKTDPRAYLTVCEVLGCYPEQVMMVTANKDFGDLEASAALGMTPQLIRDGDGPKSIIELAEQLGT